MYTPPKEIMTLFEEWSLANPKDEKSKKHSHFTIGHNFWQGKTHTESTKKLLSLLNSGENNPMFGKKLTEEQRNKISKNQTGKPLSQQHKLAISKSKVGIPRSEETKRKISEARKKSKQQL